MTKLPTLDELTAQLEAQNADLAATAELAETIGDRFTVDGSFVQALDEATEEPRTKGIIPAAAFGIRA